jgi:sugar phosphate isomerase/epimerase
MDRRTFLKTTGAAGAGIGLAALGGSRLLAAELAHGAPNAEKLGWRLGCQMWSFNRFTLFEGIDKTASLGLHYIETGAFQVISKDQPNVKFTEDSPADVRTAVKKKMADCDIKLLSWGVIPLYKDAGKSRKSFDFAKEMGIETLVAEPDEQGAFESLDRLCEEYGMKVAIHNHPQPSHYWDPDTVLKACQGRSHRIGACADTGHWMRSGLNPVECLKKLDGRIIEFHFKDINKAEPKAYDVPWGTGVCDVKAMLTEIHRQKVKGLFYIEYEHNWETSLPEIAQCVKYFDKIAAELAAADSGVPGTRPRGLRGKVRRQS